MSIVWTRPAARDLELIGDYIARENPRAVMTHRIVMVCLCGALFLRLLFTDYGYIH